MYNYRIVSNKNKTIDEGDYPAPSKKFLIRRLKKIYKMKGDRGRQFSIKIWKTSR